MPRRFGEILRERRARQWPAAGLQTRALVYASISRRAAAQRDIGQICDADIERLCGTSHADAHLVECLLSVAPTAMSPACNQAFTDTGWRTERAQQ